MLLVEVLSDGQWNEVGHRLPGDPPGTMSDNRDGIRYILRFECTGNQSSIHRLGPGIDIEIDQNRIVPDTLESAELVAILHAGESKTFALKTDKSGATERTIRFRHV